ncbi:TPA: hypothetical protein L9L54_003920 [Klebsiella quasipneumoniae subsp. similipneumoniae]|nr:hypothetical protein [Klebsiella quasipneumoniae subsp. similipneumoniae]
MLLHSNGSNTLRLLERKSGSELRYNRQIFFANDHLTAIIKIVLSSLTRGGNPQDVEKHGVDELTIRQMLDKLSSAGIPLSFWGTAWMENSTVCDTLESDKEEL